MPRCLRPKGWSLEKPGPVGVLLVKRHLGCRTGVSPCRSLAVKQYLQGKHGCAWPQSWGDARSLIHHFIAVHLSIEAGNFGPPPNSWSNTVCKWDQTAKSLLYCKIYHNMLDIIGPHWAYHVFKPCLVAPWQKSRRQVPRKPRPRPGSFRDTFGNPPCV